MNRKILFTIIPKGYWILFIFAILFVFIGGEYIAVSNIAFNLFLLLVGMKLAILVHEAGHLIFAKLAGGRPRRMVLGKRHKVFQTEFRGIKVVLNSDFNSGLAYAAFDNPRFIRAKLFTYICGGFLTNFIIAAVMFLIAGFPEKAHESVQWAAATGIANLLAGISALIPYRVNYQGLRLNSDGLSILSIPFQKRSGLAELSSVNELLDAYDLLEAKQYEKAIAIYEHFRAKTEGSKAVNLNLSVAYMKLGNYEKSTGLLEELIPLIDETPYKRHKNFIYNGLAWNYLIVNRLDEADAYSELAYKTDPNTAHIRGTRASVLIEKGKFEAGKDLLTDDVDFKFPNSQTLSAAMYLGWAFTALGQSKKARKYIAFTDRNHHLLDADEKLLYHRIKEKIAIHSEQ